MELVNCFLVGLFFRKDYVSPVGIIQSGEVSKIFLISFCILDCHFVSTLIEGIC